MEALGSPGSQVFHNLLLVTALLFFLNSRKIRKNNLYNSYKSLLIELKQGIKHHLEYKLFSFAKWLSFPKNKQLLTDEVTIEIRPNNL